MKQYQHARYLETYRPPGDIFLPLSLTPSEPCQRVIMEFDTISHASSSAQQALASLDETIVEQRDSAIRTIDFKRELSPEEYSALCIFEELMETKNLLPDAQAVIRSEAERIAQELVSMVTKPVKINHRLYGTYSEQSNIWLALEKDDGLITLFNRWDMPSDTNVRLAGFEDQYNLVSDICCQLNIQS